MTHFVLQIVKGIARVPQDNESAEIGLDQVDLLQGGFNCSEYDMHLPGLKSSAVYADSPLTDGRILISGTLGNVTETIRCELTAGTIVQLAAMLSKLLRFKQDCNDFWDTFGQIEPVYLKHQVSSEPGPRFALLYDIDIDVDNPNEPGAPNRTVTLTIEREPYWRGIAPGDNPKHWFYIANDQSQQWVFGNTHLLTGSDHRHVETVQNLATQNSNGSSYVSKNFIDIPAAKIPGDAPALVSLSVQQSVSVTATTLLVARSTKPVSGNISRDTNANQLTVYTYNAADATTGTDTSLANDTGAPQGQGGTRQRSVTTFATASLQTRLTFPSLAAIDNGLSTAVLRGRYMAFVRARLSAGSTTVSMELAVTQAADVAAGAAATLTDQGAGGTGSSTDWALVYLGVVTFPINNRTSVSSNGLGTFIHEGAAAGEVSIKLKASRSAGAGSLYVSDLILIPIDEAVIKMVAATGMGTGSSVLISWVYDNTGYYAHGGLDEVAVGDQYAVSTGISGKFDTFELAGNPLYLMPGVNNRLSFLAFVDSTKRSFPYDPSDMNVRVNIVPRWQGLRDV